MTSILEKGGSAFEGIKLLLYENPLPPLDEAIAAARAEIPRSNYYTEPYSALLRRLISHRLEVAERLIHINADSELILRQLFDRFGQPVHLLTPTYALFPEIAQRHTETPLLPQNDFAFDLAQLEIPAGTTLAVIVNPNNPNGGTFDMAPLPELLRRHPDARFRVDEAFIGMAGESVAHLVPAYPNLLVTRTLSKAHSLAGFRVGYAVLPRVIADDLNQHNDAYPLARPSEAAAIATLQHEDEIHARARQLRRWTDALAAQLRALGVRTYPTATYFFLADFAPHDAGAFVIDIRLGIITWLAAAAHEIPQELGDFAVLVHGGWKRHQALFYNLLSALTFLVGGIVAYVAPFRLDVSFLVPFAAGNFIYIGAADLIPEVKAHADIQANIIHFAAFAVGRRADAGGKACTGAVS